MKAGVLVVIIACLYINQVAADDYYIGYWREYTPNGKSFECQLVEKEEDMLSVLRAAGWDTKQGIPDINWTTDCAIIIAPSIYNKDRRLAFYGLEWTGSKFLLRYGWQADALTLSTYETIVVSFKHYVHNSNKLFCTNIGRVGELAKKSSSNTKSQADFPPGR